MVRLAIGDEARSLLLEPAFRRDWENLYHACPWATPFQSVGFVATWYEVYAEKWTPVIAYERDGAGSLTGMLPLAVPVAGRQLIVAGGHQAEYHAWLSAAAKGATFMENTLPLLRSRFPGQKLILRYVAPQAPIAWAASGPQARYCKLQPFARPLLKVGDGSELTKSLRSKNMKNSINRLKRTGEVVFEQVTNLATLGRDLDTIITYYDLRQEEMYQCRPFDQDPLKRRFHERLLAVPGLLHVTVLRAGDKLIAAHLGVAGKSAVHLGIPAYAADEARLSPSVLHLLMLGQHLARTGFEVLDLTPGDDSWKDRFATDHDEVLLLTIFPRAWQRWCDARTDQLRKLAKKGLAGLKVPARRLADLSVRPFRAFFRRKERQPVVNTSVAADPLSQESQDSLEEISDIRRKS